MFKMSGDARMFARERVYRYTNVYIIKVGVITSFVSPDVKSTTPSQHVRRYDCFPAIFIKSGGLIGQEGHPDTPQPASISWCLAVECG